MKKIMFLCHGAGNGGAERVITTLASEFSKKNYEVSMVTTNEAHNDYVLEKNVQRKKVISYAHNAIFRTFNRIFLLRKYIKEFKPDVIISFSSIPNMQSIVADFGIRNKLIISERTDPARYPTSKFGQLLRSVLYPFADIIVFQTEDARKYFSERIQKKSCIILNPIRSNLPVNEWKNTEKRIIGIGSLGEQKNWLMSLKALEIFFQSNTDYFCEIYGEGPDRGYLQNIIDTSDVLKNRVLLKGFSNDVVNILAKSSIYLSSSDYEGISNSMLEAMAVGTPAICTDCPVGGAKMMIISGENGLLVPVGDYKLMAKAIQDIANNQEYAMKLGRNAMEIRKRLNLEKILDEWEALLNK